MILIQTVREHYSIGQKALWTAGRSPLQQVYFVFRVPQRNIIRSILPWHFSTFLQRIGSEFFPAKKCAIGVGYVIE